MCGIAGIVNYALGENPARSLEQMVSCQAHRGPDGDGTFWRDNVGLGHRRLSIIDLAGGAQPFVNNDGNVIITYNGELYNYRALRDELRSKGHSFRSNSDTEVVLHAYEEWGAACPKRFEGMFAFAIADFRKREVYIARDHFGIKPLVYHLGRDGLAFASEIHSLAKYPEWTGEVDLESIEQFLRLQYIPGPRTAFRKTHKLPPGHCMTVRIGEPHIKVESYWVARFPTTAGRHAISDDELDEVLCDSVRRHLVADVPFGAFLSGGVDSSLIVGYMSRILDRPIKTFSIGFDDEGASELSYARQVARTFQTDHHEEVVSVKALDILPEVVRHYGEPFGDQSAIPTWYVSRLARKSVPMVLSGDGGDELFLGYPTYGGWLRRMQALDPDTGGRIRRRALGVARRAWPRRYVTPLSPATDPDNWLAFVGRFNHEERELLWRPEYRFLADTPSHALARSFFLQSSAAHRRVQEADISTFLPGDILTKVDIASMAFGLEVRPPLLDLRVFKAAGRIRPAALFRLDGENFEGKLPLKRILARYMGPEFSKRPKQGFSLPLDAWLYADAVTRENVRERLTGRDSPLLQWFEPTAVKHVLDRRKPENTWLLLVLDEWLRQQAGALAPVS